MGATIHEQSKEHQAVDMHNMTAASRFSDHYRMLLSVAGEYDTPARENTPIDALESQLHPGKVIVPGSENRFKVYARMERIIDGTYENADGGKYKAGGFPGSIHPWTAAVLNAIYRMHCGVAFLQPCFKR